MKKTLSVLFTLFLAILLPLSCLLETAEYGPGLSREKTNVGYDTAQHLAEKYGKKSLSSFTYTPADPKPLNAYLVTRKDCEVGINKDGIYLVSEKGLVPQMKVLLVKWAGEIEKASKGAIRFVNDPDQAEVLIFVRQHFKLYASYRSGSSISKGYSNELSFYAYDLTEPKNSCFTIKTRNPGKSIRLSGRPSKFWMNPPDFRNSVQLNNFVTKIMQWYGYNAKIGSPSSVKTERARKALIDRAYLKAETGKGFDVEMENAVKLLQKEYGLEQTGKIDQITLVALYYDKATVEDMLAKYPVSAPAKK